MYLITDSLAPHIFHLQKPTHAKYEVQHNCTTLYLCVTPTSSRRCRSWRPIMSMRCTKAPATQQHSQYGWSHEPSHFQSLPLKYSGALQVKSGHKNTPLLQWVH